MTNIRKALFISIVSTPTLQIINLISTVVLARLISPSEIGVYAIASSISVLAIEMRALGAGQYLVREKTITTQKIKSATGLMVIISFSLAAGIAIGAPYVSDFYNEQDITILLWIIASTFLLSPFTTIPHALIWKEMKFQIIFVAKFVSAVVQTVSSIWLVIEGYSYYGLAWGIFLGSVTEFLAINYYRPKGTPWLPSFSGLKGLFRFGIFTSTAQLFDRFSESISDLVIGRIGSMADVGIFSRGIGFLLFLDSIIVRAVDPVVLPFLSAIKHKGDSVGDAYLKIIQLQCAISLPVYAVVNAAAYPAIRLLFGDQWDLAIPLASILAIWAMLHSVHNFSGSAMVSTGGEKPMFIASLATLAGRFAAIIAVGVFYQPFSLVAIAWAFTLSGLIELIVKSWAIRSVMSLSFSRQLFSILPSCIVAIICWRSTVLINQFLPFEETEAWLSISVLAVIMPIVWLISIIVTDHELWSTIKKIIVDIINKIKAKKVHNEGISASKER